MTRNDVVFIEALVKFKADLDIKDAAGRAPVVIAAYEGYNECLGVLLKAGASVDAVFPGERKMHYFPPTKETNKGSDEAGDK